MRVIATATGYDNITVREPGEEFEMPDGSTAPWFKPAMKSKTKQENPKPEGTDSAGAGLV